MNVVRDTYSQRRSWRSRWRLALIFGLALLLLATSVAVVQAALQPDQVQPSDLTVRVEPVANMPSVLGPTTSPFGVAPNIGPPVTIKNKLYLIDQNDAIYRVNGESNVQQIFQVGQAPDGLALDNRQAILNISEGRAANSIFVMFTSGTAPTAGIAVYPMPAPLTGVCCVPGSPIPVDDLYRLGAIPGPIGPFFYPTRTEYQVLYEYKLAGDSLIEPRAIVAFETQSGPTHNGGGMLTTPDGRVLFATGDALPFGAEGRAAPQDPTEIVSKILLIDPDDGSIEVAAMGIRNVQHMQYVAGSGPDNLVVGFADIGGVTAEEINYVPLADLLDTSVIENFGWGRNADGLAREGTFYVGPGLPIVPGTQPPVEAVAPVPEAGFFQPQVQYGRNDPNGGVAASGPTTSEISFGSITAVWSDLASGILYATTDPLVANAGPFPAYRVNLVDEYGATLDSFQDLAGGRADPRLFRFPDGTAGVLLEATGDIYRLTQIDN